MNPLDFIYRRHAVRSYKSAVVDEAVLERLLDAAVHAPTARHEQHWEFVVVQNRGVLKRLSDRAKDLAQADEAKHGRLIKAPGTAGDGIANPIMDPDFNIFYDAGTLIAICTRDTGEFAVPDCWLAAENLMLAASAEDLGTCCIGYAVPVMNAPQTKIELSIPADVTVVAPIIVGVPRGDIPLSDRQPASILSWIR